MCLIILDGLVMGELRVTLPTVSAVLPEQKHEYYHALDCFWKRFALFSEEGPFPAQGASIGFSRQCFDVGGA